MSLFMRARLHRLDFCHKARSAAQDLNPVAVQVSKTSGFVFGLFNAGELQPDSVTPRLLSNAAMMSPCNGDQIKLR